jgi:hypothetical protein
MNLRFQTLLNSYCPIRVDFSSQSKSILQHCQQQLIIPNRYKIITLSFYEQSDINLFFTMYTIDSSFRRLRSLIIKNITSVMLVSVLKELVYLPCLISLTIGINDDSELLGDVYQLIFRLPLLRFMKISLTADEQFEQLPYATNTEVSSIEHLVIDYPCTLDELLAILSYTPKLNCLICTELSEPVLNITNHPSIKLPNLTYLIIKGCRISFDEFEIFIKKISSQLQVLRINTFQDEIYMDSDRWQRLILEQISHLLKFYFLHRQRNNNAFQKTRYYALLNGFTSSFWIERQWSFEIEIDDRRATYSIRPYR